MQFSTGDLITVVAMVGGLIGATVGLLVRALVLDKINRHDRSLKAFGERLGGHDVAIAVLQDFRDRAEEPAPYRRRTSIHSHQLPDEPSK